MGNVVCAGCGSRWVSKEIPSGEEVTLASCKVCFAVRDGYRSVTELVSTIYPDPSVVSPAVWSWFDVELNAKVMVGLTRAGVDIACGDDLPIEEMAEGGFRVCCSFRSLMRTFGPHLWSGEKVFAGSVRIRGYVRG